MNKISKKILAIVTMVAFVVTMMPFAAFAASKSYAEVSEDTLDIEAVNETAEITVTVDAGDANNNVIVWFTDEDDNIYRYTTVTEADGVSAGEGNFKGTAVMYNAQAKAYTVKVAFADGGEYTAHAGVDYGNDADTVNNLDEYFDFDGENVINVYAEEATVDALTVTSVTGTGIPEDEFTATGTNTATVNMGSFLANSTAKATVKGHVDTTGSIADQTVAISTNKSSTLKLSTAEAKVDRNGNFEFTFQVSKKTDYKIYLKAGDKEFTLNLDYAQEGAEVKDITTSVNNDAILEAENANVDFSDAVQFVITDENGNELGDTITEPAETPDVDYVDIVSKPDRSRLEASDIALYYNTDKDVWTLDYKGDADSAKRDLIAGEYTVSISVSSGESAEATFTLAEAGDPVGIEVELTGDKTGLLEDTVVDGEKVTGKVYLVDKNGIKTATDYFNSSVGGDAVANDVNRLSFTVNAGDEDQYMGSTITVTVLEPDKGFMVSKELTVVDGKTTNTLAFDSENGAANTANTVKVTLVDENGDLVKTVDGAMHAYISDQSNEDANVEVDVTNDAMNGGKGTLTIFSDKETTVDVVVAVVDANTAGTNSAIYAATLEYTIGEEAVDADTTVAMTIGSSDIIVNNDIVSGDAAPYVDSNWRTMVPLRALTEAFGGTAEWDGDARTVTVENGDTTIVFDADSNKYTVNGEEKEMDTNLVINDGRTYVPVRFVAEELGYQITVLKDAQNLTAGVVFQK